MHSAPSVTYPVGRSRFQGGLIALTGMIGGVTGLLWWHQADVTGWRQGLFAAVLIFSLAVALHAWYRSPRGELHWDGQALRWTSGEAVLCGSVTVHLDFQIFLLLSLRTQTGSRIWLWPERQADVTRWAALRRAVYSRISPAQVRDENSTSELSQVSI